jgi:hypothetical protein
LSEVRGGWRATAVHAEKDEEVSIHVTAESQNPQSHINRPCIIFICLFMYTRVVKVVNLRKHIRVYYLQIYIHLFAGNKL